MEFQMAKNQKKDEAEEERKRRARLRGELPMEDEEEEEVWDPANIRTIMPFVNPDGKQQFVVSTQGQFNGWLYVGDINEERPVQAIKLQIDSLPTYMELNPGKDADMIVIGYENGLIEIVMDYVWEKRITNKFHDGRHGLITAAILNKDENFFISSAQDGLIFVHQFDKKCAINEAKKDLLEGIEGVNFMAREDKEVLLKKKQAEYQVENPPVYPETEDQLLDEAALAITIKNREPTGLDVEDPKIYSIQQSKLRTEEDHRLMLAEKKKTQVRNQINRLREWFKRVDEQNEGSDKHLRAHEDDF